MLTYPTVNYLQCIKDLMSGSKTEESFNFQADTETGDYPGMAEI